MAKITITLGDHSRETDINNLGRNAQSKEKNIKQIVRELCEAANIDEDTGLPTFTYKFSSEKSVTETENALIQAIERAITAVRGEHINTIENAVPPKKDALITPAPIVSSEPAKSVQTAFTPPPPPPPKKKPSLSEGTPINIEPTQPLEKTTTIVKPQSSNEEKQSETTPFSLRTQITKRRGGIVGIASKQQNLEPFPCQLKLITDAQDAKDQDVLYVYFNHKKQLEFSFRTNINEVTTKLLEDPYELSDSDDNYSDNELSILSDKNDHYLSNTDLSLLKNQLKSGQAIDLLNPQVKTVVERLLAYASKSFAGKKLTIQSTNKNQLKIDNNSSEPTPSTKENVDLSKLEQHLNKMLISQGLTLPSSAAVKNLWQYTRTLMKLIGGLVVAAKQKMQARIGTPPQVIPPAPAPYTKASVQLGDEHSFFNGNMEGPISALLDVFQQLGVNPSDPKRIKLHFFETEQAQAFKTHFIQSHENRNQAKQDGKVLPAYVLWSSEPPLEAEQTAVIIDTPYWPHDAETLDALLNAVVACNINVNQIYLRADEETLALFSRLKERSVRVSTPLSLPKSLDFSVHLHDDDDDSEDEFSLNYTKFTKPSGFFCPYESIDDPFSEETKHEDPSSTPGNTSPEQTEPRASASGNFSQPSAREDKKDTNSESTESNESEINPAPSTSFSFLLNAMAQNKVATSASLALMIGGIGLACAGIVLFPGTVPLALIVVGLVSLAAGVALSCRILTTGSLGFHSRGTTEPPLINDSEHSAESEEHLNVAVV
jgi:hypothetical protein